MIALAGTLLLAASVIEASGLIFDGAGNENQARPLQLLDVPYISQSEALCGGAAASMVLRYWGEAGVNAEDFASLVDRSAGGIRTADLVGAVQARGSTAVAARGTAGLAQAELRAGRPVIALVEDRPGAFHYVVLVGWHERAVVFHDPARTPFVVMRPLDFERRWKVSGNWMVAITRGPEDRPPQTETFNPPAPGAQGLHAPTSCDAIVAEGVGYAEHQDLLAAERVLADAVYQCSGAAALRELAGVRLLQRRWPEMRELAGQAVAIDPGDTHAWRLLATGRYITGDRIAALDAWNQAGEPLVDLVSASGLQRTTHRTVERLVGLDPGQVLTSDDFNRARRRLDELPAALSTRLEYVAQGGGRVEVRAHVTEPSVVPRGWLTWALMAARTAATREFAVGINSLSQHGERLEASWRFWPHRPAYGVSLVLPAGDVGLITLEGFSEEQPFTTSEVPTADRAGARAAIANWASGALRWEVHGGLDRWAREGAFGLMGARARLEHQLFTMTLGGDAWLGDTRFAAGEIAGHWASSRDPRGTVFVVRGGFELVGVKAPLALWPAADTGHARAPLARAHPVLNDGRLDVQRLGRGIAHAGIEIQRWRQGPGPLAVGIAGFLDTARTGRRIAGKSLGDADLGLGLRAAIPGHRGLFRVDIAHGLADGRNALSVVWEP